MLNVQIREYDVPTPKSRPHDPAVAPDGCRDAEKPEAFRTR